MKVEHYYEKIHLQVMFLAFALTSAALAQPPAPHAEQNTLYLPIIATRPDVIAYTLQSSPYVDQSDIAVANRDGSNHIVLTHTAGGEHASQPDWSPDGAHIAYVAGGSGETDLYIMDADGSNQHRLIETAQREELPAWSPAGTQIAVSGGYIVNADGSGIRTTPNLGTAPAWLPDGTQIAFSQWTSLKSFSIFVINLDGSGETMLPFGPLASDPDWRPRPIRQ